MKTTSTFHEIPGGEALLSWFGRAPSFHDATLLDLEFRHSGEGLLRILAWNTTSDVDARGYFILDKHAEVSFALEGVSAINLMDFDMIPGIIFELELIRSGEQYRIEWSTSYGVTGFVIARQVTVSVAARPPE